MVAGNAHVGMVILVVLYLLHLELANGVWIDFGCRRLVHLRDTIVVCFLGELRKLHFVTLFAVYLSLVWHVARGDFFRLARV